MANTNYKYLIVGAGQAGCRAALALREADPEGNVMMIGSERHPPYERPALSKGVMSGNSAPQSVIIRQVDELGELGIETLLGHTVVQIDPENHIAILDDDSHISFNKLLLATGSIARQLAVPGADLDNIHTLRTLDDSLAISHNLSLCQNLAIIGAGFIGLEVAATASERFGCNVTVVEAGTGILQRGVPDELREAIQNLHSAKGTRFHFTESVSSFKGNGKLEQLRLASGKVLEADCAIIGIGVVPDTSLAERAGLEVSNGIVVNEYGETSHPDIFAAGEVTHHRNLFLGNSQRFESWQIAQNQSVVAAKSMIGEKQAYDEIPWFWTDQFGYNFQLIGSTKTNGEKVTRAYDGSQRSTTFYLENSDVVGALCINSGKDVALVRKAIRSGMNVTREQLADPSVNLKRHITKQKSAA